MSLRSSKITSWSLLPHVVRVRDKTREISVCILMWHIMKVSLCDGSHVYSPGWAVPHLWLWAKFVWVRKLKLRAQCHANTAFISSSSLHSSPSSIAVGCGHWVVDCPHEIHYRLDRAISPKSAFPSVFTTKYGVMWWHGTTGWKCEGNTRTNRKPIFALCRGLSDIIQENM